MRWRPTSSVSLPWRSLPSTSSSRCRPAGSATARRRSSRRIETTGVLLRSRPAPPPRRRCSAGSQRARQRVDRCRAGPPAAARLRTSGTSGTPAGPRASPPSSTGGCEREHRRRPRVTPFAAPPVKPVGWMVDTRRQRAGARTSCGAARCADTARRVHRRLGGLPQTASLEPAGRGTTPRRAGSRPWTRTPGIPW